MSEIKNCPFCQAKAMPDQPIPNAFLIDHKQGCFLTSTVFYPGDYKSVAKSWNARVLPPEVERLAKACAGILGRYVSLVDSGDAGFWEAEEVPEVIEARAALAALKGEDHGKV